MREKIMLALSVVILAALTFGIYEKEQIIAHGETLLFQLAPVDPRSLMQGDYMRLRYAIERETPTSELSPDERPRYIVVLSGENNVAQFVRFHRGEALSDGEKLVNIRRQGSAVRLRPNSFLFQEGHAQYYENAKFGVFKFDAAGNRLLVGLADEDGKTITVPEGAEEGRP